MSEEEEKKEEPKPFNWIVPQCCREGWEDCPHVAKKPKPVKANIGL